jgi:hypothetical protein
MLGSLQSRGSKKNGLHIKRPIRYILIPRSNPYRGTGYSSVNSVVFEALYQSLSVVREG